MKRILFGLLMPLAFLQACEQGLSDEDMAILHEAKSTHNQAYALQQELDGLMADIAEHKNALQMRLSSINAEENNVGEEQVEPLKNLLVEVENLTEELTTWKAELVEVEIPGEEHDHDHEGHDHGHDHAHDPALELTPVQMLELQKEQKAIIEAIMLRARQVKTQLELFTSSQIETED
jgi:hypothetical protein